MRTDSAEDWTGTERVRGKVNGVSFETCTNLPFGDDQSCAGFNPTPTHFTGKLWDGETGLDYFNARYYSSNAGRWMLPDWSAVPEPVPYADLANPQTLNLYTYVGNNPLGAADADGHYSEGSNGGQPCGYYGTVPSSQGGTSGYIAAQVPCSSPAAGDPTETIVDNQVQQPGSPLVNSNAVAQCPNNFCTGFWASASGASGYPDITKGINDWNGRFLTNAQFNADVVQPGIDAQHAALAAKISLLTGQDYQAVYAALADPSEAVHGGNADFTAKAGLDLSFLRSSKIAFHNRTYGSPSVHMDHGTIHLDTVSPYSYYGLGLLGHFFTNVLLGNINGGIPY
ncbi:MAG: RHS repeat-associated core domain-containing protein [Acidobacteriaceae bacterium]